MTRHTLLRLRTKVYSGDLGYFAVSLAVFIIGFIKLNRFLSFTEGWWSVYSQYIDRGLIPYKDFNMVFPPAFPYLAWVVEHAVGHNFLRERFVGLVIETSIAVMIYSLLKKRIAKSIAIPLAIFGCIYLYSGNTPLIFDYNYFAVFFVLLSIHHLDKAMIVKGQLWNFKIFISGIFLGFSFLIKQSFASTVFVLLTILSMALILKEPRKMTTARFLRIYVFGLGFVFPILVTGALLTYFGALPQFFHSVFQSSISAKGNLATVMFGWIININKAYSIRKEVLALVLILMSIYLLDRLANRYFSKFDIFFVKYRKVTLFSYVLILTLCIFEYISISHGITHHRLTLFFLEFLNPLVAHNHIALPILCFLFWIYYIVTAVDNKWTLLLTCDLGFIWGGGLSGGVDQYALFLPTVTGFALLWTFLRSKNLISSAVWILVTIWIAGLSVIWAQVPYSWWGYSTSSIHEESMTSRFGYTKGLRTDSASMAVLNSVEAQLNSNHRCTRRMISFPNMPLFQLDTNYLPIGKNAVYWFDVSTPQGINEDIKILQSEKPAAVLVETIPDYVWHFHSILFNNGKPFTQATLYSNLMENEKDKLYLWSSFPIPNSPGYIIHVAIRKDCL